MTVGKKIEGCEGLPVAWLGTLVKASGNGSAELLKVTAYSIVLDDVRVLRIGNALTR
jgi:hypothetical protein